MNSHFNREFLRQIPSFLNQTLSMLGVNSVDALGPLSGDLAAQLEPVLIRDPKQITEEEKRQLRLAFYGREGVAAFVLAEPDCLGEHPLLLVARQITDILPVAYPIAHPAEEETRAGTVQDKYDGTLKVFQRADQVTSHQTRYLHMHQDGVGLGGGVATVGLYCENGPLWGGLTVFQNVLRLAAELARVDFEAFRSLFSPRALTITRKTGNKALRITGPVLYLNTLSQPQVFLRAAGGDYEMSWAKSSALLTAKEFFETYLRPFAAGSRFLPLSTRGQGCFVSNPVVLHGRTTFFDYGVRKRVLARKWFGLAAEDTRIKQVPGLNILKDYAALCPELFGDDMLRGRWKYDDVSGRNILVDEG